jgi:hypothetical protein
MRAFYWGEHHMLETVLSYRFYDLIYGKIIVTKVAKGVLMFCMLIKNAR